MVAETDVLADVPDGLFIGGEWVASSTGATFDVEDPSSGAAIKAIADATPEDGIRALDAAVAVQDDWSASAPRARGEILRRAFEMIQSHKDDVALLMTLEMGKPLADSYAEVNYGSEFLRWFSEEAVRIAGRYGRNPEGSGTMVVSERPVGPCLLITPWNFPLAMATRKIGPALAAGCTAVVKPAGMTPLTTMYVAKLLDEAGLPKGVLNVVPTSHSGALSGPILADPRLRKLSFTGSTEVGRILLQQAAEGILRTSMELGGNAPFVVFDDADLDKAIAGAMLAKFRNIGEACTAANRFLVHHSLAAKFADGVAERVAAMRMGRGTEEGVAIGPLINTEAVDKADGLVQDAIAKGAVLVAGGHRLEGPGTFYEPTVVTAVPPNARILREEIFGPVVSIVEFETEDEAVRLANDTEYGLVSYVFTESLARGQRMIDRLDTGMMGLNVGVISNPAAPFGGVKHSGIGREGGPEGIHEYLATKYTLLPSA